MSLTRLHKDRGLRRVVPIVGPRGGRPHQIVLRVRWCEALDCWQIAAAPLGRKRSRLRWRPLRSVLVEAFGLDFGEKQLTLMEVKS